MFVEVLFGGEHKENRLAQACDNPTTGHFKENHSSLSETVDRVIRDGKVFVGIISTCTVLLQTLPTAPRSERGSLIQKHVDTVSKPGTLLPDNLRSFLLGEMKNGDKPSLLKKRKAAD